MQCTCGVIEWLNIVVLLLRMHTYDSIDLLVFIHAHPYTQAVLDYQVYFMNVSDANLHNSTTWQLEYSAKVLE